MTTGGMTMRRRRSRHHHRHRHHNQSRSLGPTERDGRGAFSRRARRRGRRGRSLGNDDFHTSYRSYIYYTKVYVPIYYNTIH